MDPLSQEMERYFEDGVKRHQADLKNKTRNLRSQLAPIVTKLCCHPVSKILGLYFHEPYLSVPSLDILSEDDEELNAGSISSYRVMLPITLDQTIWKYQPPDPFEEHRAHRIHLKDDSPGTSMDVSVNVSQEVHSLDELPEIFRDFGLRNMLRFSPGLLEVEVRIFFGTQGMNILVDLRGDCFIGEFGLSLKLYPSLNIISQDKLWQYLLPRSLQGQSGQWRKFYSTEERQLILKLDGEDHGIRYKVNSILTYASRPGSSSPLSILEPYVYTNAVLNMGNDPEWNKNSLGVAFRMTLAYVKYCLGHKVLNRYFEAEHNLLATVPETRLQYLLQHLTTEGTSSYGTLLC